jgi:alpha-L-fucosidase
MKVWQALWVATAATVALLAGTPVLAGETEAQRDARMQWWREARFGLFIHWGLYSIPAGEWADQTHHGEWILNTAQIPVVEYEKLAGQFDPVRFDPDEWARIAAGAGMKYVVITSKHHDGFCLFDSAHTEYDVMATPFARDILHELADACHREGLRIGWYHSIMDWHHPDYLPRRGWEQRSSDGAQFARYVDHLENQVRELLTNYGPIGVMWFDGEWEETWTHQHGLGLYSLVRSLQPNVIVNNRVDKGRGGMAGLTTDARFAGDFGTPEQEIPATGLPGVDWETCMTMNNHWGYNKHDQDWKSTEDLLRKLADIASKGGNFLLNVGPTAEGTFPPEAIERLRDIGAWMGVHGEAIHGTQAGPFKTLPWGRCTQRPLEHGGTRLYLHVFDWPKDGRLVVPGLFNDPLKAHLLGRPAAPPLADFERVDDALVISVPRNPPDRINSVVVLDIAGRPDVNEPPDISAPHAVFVDALDVTIRSDRPDVEVRYTTDGTLPGPSSPLADDTVRLTETTRVLARAWRGERPVSSVAEATFEKVEPRRGSPIGGFRRGVFYEYYEGAWDRLPDFRRLVPVKQGIIGNFDLSLRGRPERYAFRYHSLLTVPADGVYDFFTLSDDGSRLYVGDRLVVDNDGLHGMREATGEIALAAGAHPITVAFFERTGSDALEVWYEGPGIEKRRIPDEVLNASSDDVLPSPSARQLDWQRMEFHAFVHFGINTFTNREWGDGTEDPALFNPTGLDARQWVRVFKDAGMKQVILSAKHHDGFCLWPTRFTAHSVANSPWKGGQGDLVREVAEACREAGLKFGIYLSPWDRHEPTYGSEAYNQFYKNQLTELLTGYGPIHEVWFDGACGEGPNGRRQVYDWNGYFETVRRLQPEAVIFSDAGPDVRWVGNEAGHAGETNWSTLRREAFYPGTPDYAQLTGGHEDGAYWVPAECDVSIRPGWFYHTEQDTQVKSVGRLLDIYYKSVGRNGSLLLNVPPDRRGLIHERDARHLAEFRSILDESFRNNLAARKNVTASSVRDGVPRHGPDAVVDEHADTWWMAEEGARCATLAIEFGEPVTFDRALIQERIQLGQRIRSFRIDALSDGAWRPVVEGTTVGYKRLLRFPVVTASRVRLTVLDARACPTVSEFGVFRASPRERDPEP